MNRLLPLLAAVSLVTLAACQKEEQKPEAATAEASAASTTTADEVASDASASQDTNVVAGSAAEPTAFPKSDRAARTAPTSPIAIRPPAPTLPQLAMAYRLGLVLPADQVRPLMESHQEACELAGPLQCQVMGASSGAEGRDRARAELTLRATPAWMRAFRTRAENDARDAGGKINQAGTVGEDLSGGIVDTEAAQRARAAELERLQDLMQRRTRDLEDTLQVEQEITRVQTEIDQAASQLALMRSRIAMQTLTVDYRSKGMLAPDGAGAPIAEASESFLSTMAWVFAALIRLASLLTPFVLIGAPIAWLVARARKTRKPAPATTAAPQQHS